MTRVEPAGASTGRARPDPAAGAEQGAEPADRLMATYAPAPPTFVRGQGSRLYDAEGREYLDFLCGIAVTTLGHAHPAVADAVCAQVRTLSHVSNLFRNEVGPALAVTVDRLVSAAVGRAGGGTVDGKVFFTNSGAEANECAFKLARKWAGDRRRSIVSVDGAFHGRTFGALAATGQPDKQRAFEPLPGGFVHLPVGDAGALDSVLSAGDVAAVVLEPIQGERGVRPLPNEFVRQCRRLCDEYGSLLVMDEIQTGLGRTGAWFGFEHHAVAPDVVTIAKALGNGMPIGACWARAQVAATFAPGDHGSTFGGQPLAAAAAVATLRVIEDDHLVEKAAVSGLRLAALLARLPSVVEVRGKGLLVGVGLAGSVDAKAVAAAALERGLVVNAIGTDTLRLAPPLTITGADLDRGVAILGEALESVGARPVA